MRATINIVCLIGIFAVLAFPHLPDINIPIDDGGQSKIEEAFSGQLAAYFTEIANADKTIQEKQKAIELAFENSAKSAYAVGMQSQVEAIPDDETDTGSLDELLLKVAEEMQ